MIFTHPSCFEHDMGEGHPESPARLAVVVDALQQPRFQGIEWRRAPTATVQQLLRVHDRSLIDRVFNSAPSDGYHRLDPDTAMNRCSLQAALHAAGAAVAAVEAVLAGTSPRAFCAVRPPGHHATRFDAMGFCLFNNIAVAAAHALHRGIARLAIVDFDVHHGNGTQDIFAEEPRVLFVSSHQYPLYPGSGDPDEHGIGNIFNAGLMVGARSLEFRETWLNLLLPAVEAFAPELILVSAGFDAHRLDPLAQLNLQTEDYAWITERIVEIAERHADGRVVSSLEGGYSLTALRESVGAHCAALFDLD
ncbi:MAG: histone deacetylase family protein [Lysobacterales bacterium]